jgi:hypothetical protein
MKEGRQNISIKMPNLSIKHDGLQFFLSFQRMPERLSRYKKYHIAGTKIYDNMPLGA